MATLPLPVLRRHRRSRLGRLRGIAALLAALGGLWESPVAAAAGAPFARWEQLRAEDLRVAAIAYRLSVANRRLCPRTLAPQRGFVLHGIDQYGAVDRREAARLFGLGSRVAVMAVVPGSPAQLAGLAADDQLLAVNGRALNDAGFAANAEATREPVERAQHILAEEMAKGEVVLRVAGSSGLHDLRFTAEIGCASNVELVTGKAVNAWADGQRVEISDGIVARCRTDGDLALVIAHEIAHNLLHHGQRSAAGGAQLRLRLTGSGSAEMRETEEEADRLGVRLARTASYDLSDAVSFLGALLAEAGVGETATTHPAPARRLALLRAAIAAPAVSRRP